MSQKWEAAVGATVVMLLLFAGPSASGQTPRPAASAPAPAAATTRPKPPPVWLNGQAVEVKWGGLWRKAVVKNKGNGWVLVNFTPGPFHEWVEPWRVRATGSKEDTIGYATPGETLTKPAPPPTAKPGPPPVDEKEKPADAGQTVATPQAATPTTAPVAGVALGESASEPPPAPALAPVGLALKTVDAAAVRTVDLVHDTGQGWSVMPDGGEPFKTVAPKPITLNGSKGEIFQRVESLFFAAPASPTAIVVHHNVRPGQPTFRVERVDLAAGRSVATMTVPVPIQALSVSGDGKLLLATGGGHGASDSGDRIDVWSIAAGQAAQQVTSFIPFAAEQMSMERTVVWGAFVSPDTIVTATAGKIAVWDFRNAKAVWSAKIDSIVPALSPGGKYLALVAEKDVLLIEAATGKILARHDTGRRVYGTLAFSPDGKQLAHVGQDVMHVWDVATGKPVMAANTTAFAQKSIEWLSEGYLLLDGEYVFDLKKHVMIWQYRGGERARGVIGGRLWYVASAEGPGHRARDGQWVLTSAALPEPEVVTLIDKLGDDLYALKPGAKLSVDVSALPGDMQPKAREGLTKKLTESGFVVAEGQPTRLLATVESGKTVPMSYRNFGAPPGAEETKVSATEQISKVALVDASGARVWEGQSKTIPPMSLSLKQGQSVDQAVADAMKASGWFFQNVQIPQFVTRSRKAAQGFSNLTPRGAEGAQLDK